MEFIGARICTQAIGATLGGGYRSKKSFIEYTKNLIDKLNAYNATINDNLTIDNFTNTTYSMTYYNSIIVIEKRTLDKNSVATAIIGEDKFCFV